MTLAVDETLNPNTTTALNISNFSTHCQCLLEVTVMILTFRTDRSRQTVQTHIRLLLEEQSDQGLPCLLIHCTF